MYVEERFIGCCLKIVWRCSNGHVGDWHSSEQLKNVYVDNIMVAASLLLSGNNFSKLSLFAKSLELAFLGSSTYHKYQKVYLAPQVQFWWHNMQS